MASYLSPFNKLIFETVRRSSESQSEISSVDSDWSDIKSIALQLGVSNPDDLTTERFKIDRQKLENMMRSDNLEDGISKAEQFFDNTMKTTSTFISWPCRMKIGAKTKKDPHVRIVGKPDDVSKAKERILESLDSRGIRVIMKIDISYTDHSYIIGRGGTNIKRIMEETMTHIHFPDSNRSNPSEKSNQVSLCGSLEGVERARSLVRSSTPLIISFELPIMAPGRPVPDNDTPYVREVEAKFSIQVIFSTRPKLHSSLVLVKGSEKEAAKVQEATQLLINFMCESIANQIQVNLQLEISPHHQDIVKGKNNAQLLDIMDRTKTKIIFPDVKDVNIKPLKKSQVTITGNIDGVYRARQQLIGNLPVALVFDYPENTIDTSNTITLGHKYGVYITVRQKSRQSIMGIVLKGVEKFVDKMYEARHELLKLTTPVLKPEIPSTYFAPYDHDMELNYRKSLAMLLANYPESPMTPNAQMGSHFMSPFGQLPNKYASYASPSIPRLQQHNDRFRMHPQLQQFQQQQFQQHQQQFQQQQTQQTNPFLSPYQNTNLNHAMSTTNLTPHNNLNTSANTSGYHSYSSSTNSLEQLFPPYQGQGAAAAAIMAAATANYQNQFNNNNNNAHNLSATSDYTPNNSGDFNLDAGGLRRMSSSNSAGSLNAAELQQQQLGQQIPHQAQQQPLQSDGRMHNYELSKLFPYDRKKVEGYKAMERAPQGEVRTPTSQWAGLNLSKTSPYALETVPDQSVTTGSGGASASANAGAAGGASGSLSQWSRSETASPYSMSSTTGLMDALPAQQRAMLGQHKDIHSLMTHLGLEHYISTFVVNEIDIDMFLSLTPENLTELKITAFGPRKKLLMAISTLNAHHVDSLPQASSKFFGSAAPGAERRLSSDW